MNKFLVAILAIVIMLVSCTDKEQIAIDYQAKVTVSASKLFEPFHSVINDDDFSMNKEGYGEWQVNLHLLVYDENGILLKKEEASFPSLVPNLTTDLSLAPGKYTLVSIAEFNGIYANQAYRFWTISNENRLADLQIVESDVLVTSPFETLGIDTREVSIDDKPSSVHIEIAPVTGLVEMIFWCDDLAGNTDNEFSQYANYIDNVVIYASQLKQVVRFNGTALNYEYNSQSTTYLMNRYHPSQMVQNGKSKQILGYRALLPIEDRDFFWELDCKSGYGQYLFADGKDHQQSTDTSKLSIKSCGQYVMDLVLDAFYLWVDEYNPSIGMMERMEKNLADYNRKAIQKILDENFVHYIGMSQKMVETYWGEEPLFSQETTVTYPGKGLALYMTVRFTDSQKTKSNRIMLTMKAPTDQLKELVTEVLSEMYTPLSDVSTAFVKHFINADTKDKATVGITWDYLNQSLYFDAVNVK